MNPALMGALMLAAGAPIWLAKLAFMGVPVFVHGQHPSTLALLKTSSFVVAQTRSGKDS